jgi:hypothetical protein
MKAKRQVKTVQTNLSPKLGFTQTFLEPNLVVALNQPDAER